MTMMTEVGAKRSYDEYEGNESPKRSRSGRLELRLLLVGRYCGAIIGKGGDTVKRLREKHRVHIRGLNNHAENRVLSITGDRENCINALTDILPVTSSEAPYAATNPKDRCQYEINFLVHSGHVGAVIGKGGSKIKEITDASSGMIKIYQDCLPNSNERVIAIGGDTVERIIVAMDIVLDTLEHLPQKSQIMFYDPTKDDSGIVSNRGDSGPAERRSDNQMSTSNHLPIGGGLNRSLGTVGGLNLTGATGLLGQLSAGGGAGASLGSGGQPGGYGGQSGGFGMNHAQMGNTLASQLGNPLGSQLGNHLGSQLGNQLGSQLQSQLGNHLQSQLGSQLGNQLGSQLQSQLGSQLQSQLGSQLQSQLGSQLQSQLGSQLQSQLGSQLQSQLGSQLQHQMGRNMPVVSPRQTNHPSRDHYHRNGNEADILDFTKMHTITKVTVSQEMCGAVIGKSGRNIKEIRHTSGARINFEGNEKGSKEDRVITMTGTQKQIQIAEQMMTQFVSERNN